MDPRGQLLLAALGLRRLLDALLRPLAMDAAHLLDSWFGIGHVAVGVPPPRLRSATDAVRRPWLARDLLHDRDGAFAHERDGTGWERTPWHATQRVAWEALGRAHRP